MQPELQDNLVLPAINSHKRGSSSKFDRDVDPEVVERPSKLDQEFNAIDAL